MDVKYPNLIGMEKLNHTASLKRTQAYSSQMRLKPQITTHNTQTDQKSSVLFV